MYTDLDYEEDDPPLSTVTRADRAPSVHSRYSNDFEVNPEGDLGAANETPTVKQIMDGHVKAILEENRNYYGNDKRGILAFIADETASKWDIRTMVEKIGWNHDVPTRLKGTNIYTSHWKMVPRKHLTGEGYDAVWYVILKASPDVPEHAIYTSSQIEGFVIGPDGAGSASDSPLIRDVPSMSYGTGYVGSSVDDGVIGGESIKAGDTNAGTSMTGAASKENSDRSSDFTK